MPAVEFGGTNYTSNSGLFPIYTPGIGLPSGRVCSDGVNRAGITQLYAYVGGYYGTDSVSLAFGSASTSTFDMPGGGPHSTGWIGTNIWAVNGGSATFYIYGGSRLYFYRGGGYGTTYDSSGAWSGASTILGGYFYILPPLGPTITSVVSSEDGTSATVTYTAPGDNGGSSITGYNVQRATATNFASPTTISRTNAQFTATFTGLTPGANYYYRVTARNALTNAVSVLGGAWSATVSRVQNEPAGLGRQRRGSAWVENAGRRRSSGGTWQDIEGRRWNGSSWVKLGR